MTAILLDTHAWVWSLSGDDLLSPRARALIAGATSVHVSPISFFEIGQKVRLGKWPEMERHVHDLSAILNRQGGMPAPLTPDICLRAATMPWDHRDPFDRILAATCELTGLLLISKDPAFATLPDLACFW